MLFGGGSRRDAEFADAVRSVELSIAESIAALIDVDGLEPEQRQLLAHGIVGLAEGTSRHWVAHGMAGSPEDLTTHVAALAWAGFRGIRG